MSVSSNAAARKVQQKFDFFCVIHFAVTCDKSTSTPTPQEIIEFSAVLINSSTLAPESEFHQYVRPVIHSELTPFCTNITGIFLCKEKIDPDPWPLFLYFKLSIVYI